MQKILPLVGAMLTGFGKHSLLVSIIDRTFSLLGDAALPPFALALCLLQDLRVVDVAVV